MTAVIMKGKDLGRRMRGCFAEKVADKLGWENEWGLPGCH